MKNSKPRNISVTLEQAKKWYNTGDSILQELALSVYNIAELINDEFIEATVDRRELQLIVPCGQELKMATYNRLAILAKFFNGDWVMEVGKIGYFFGKVPLNKLSGVSLIEPIDDIEVFSHSTSMYAGIIYFKNIEDALKAAALLGEDLKNLF